MRITTLVVDVKRVAVAGVVVERRRKLEVKILPEIKPSASNTLAPTRTTQLYDRRRDEVSLDEVERIVI